MRDFDRRPALLTPRISSEVRQGAIYAPPPSQRKLAGGPSDARVKGGHVMSVDIESEDIGRHAFAA